MAERAGIPDDSAELLHELEANAAEQRRLLARLDQIKARRTDLVDAVRDRKLRTWREIAALYAMTEAALQLARKTKKARQKR
jgi:hypothetical protein